VITDAMTLGNITVTRLNLVTYWRHFVYLEVESEDRLMLTSSLDPTAGEDKPHKGVSDRLQAVPKDSCSFA
jgi:hypothetical protein